jgi:hypothetical protein
MQGIEIAFCNVGIGAVIGAWQSIMESTAYEALEPVPYGKNDTIGLDARPEIIITSRLKQFDRHSLVITEELYSEDKKRWPSFPDKILQPIMFFSDPTDRSKFLKKFIELISKDDKFAKIGDLQKKYNFEEMWEKEFKEAPVSITGPTSSITCVRKGSIIFSVILNYITETIFVACSLGVYYLKLPDHKNKKLKTIDLSYIIDHGKELTFLCTEKVCATDDEAKKFVTFLGKEGYRENFKDSMIFVDEPEKYLHHSEPGGPARILYLSELQKSHGPIGFVLANGEKIGEWISWLPFVKFAKNTLGAQALKVFEVYIERPWFKDGVLMTTSPSYSIFNKSDDNEPFLDISRLKNYDSPNKFRSMLAVVPKDNERLNYIMTQHQYRNVTKYF